MDSVDTLPKTPANKYMKVAEIALRYRCSKDTIRRKIAAGKLRDLEWIDPFNDGKLLATTESVERFDEKRHKQMEKVLRGQT